MIAIRNINNNVSLCLDSRNKAVVVFGKGVGFIKPPHEIPLSKIERSFYDVDEKYLSFLNDIPSDFITFTAHKLVEMQDRLPYPVNSNLVFTLADHISFAIKRTKKGIYVPMPSIFEMEADYPGEIAVAREFVASIEKEFGVQLPKNEIQGVAMHFVNARGGDIETSEKNLEENNDRILEDITCIIEHEMDMEVRRDTFNYSRFATHMRYLLKRLLSNKHVDSANLQLYEMIQSEYSTVSGCVDKISDYLQGNWKIRLTEEEKMYLILHVNRVCCGDMK